LQSNNAARSSIARSEMPARPYSIWRGLPDRREGHVGDQSLFHTIRLLEIRRRVLPMTGVEGKQGAPTCCETLAALTPTKDRQSNKRDEFHFGNHSFVGLSVRERFNGRCH